MQMKHEHCEAPRYTTLVISYCCIMTMCWQQNTLHNGAQHNAHWNKFWGNRID